MPPTLQARLGLLRTSPRTSLVLPPMRSKPPVLPRSRASVRPRGVVSAGGSVSSFRRRFASLCLTISGCATKSAGQCLTAELIRFVGRRGHLDQAVLLHGAVDAASRVALEAAHDLRFRKSFSSPTSDVGACGWIPAHADEQDAPEGVVSLAVAAPVQSVSLSSSRRCRQRRWTPGGRRHASSRRSCGAPRRANPLRASRRLPRSRPLSAPAMAPSAGRRRGGGLVLRSSKAVHELAAEFAGRRGGRPHTTAERAG